MTWTLRTTRVASDLQLEVLSGGAPATVDQVLGGLSGGELTPAWTEALRAAPFAAFCFETPALRATGLGRPFVARLVDSPTLARAVVDRQPFSEHFALEPWRTTVVFDSLGRDARLVAPCPVQPEACCAHLAVFLRGAPEAAVAAWWSANADELRRQLSADQPRWWSTAGLGVSWLHGRIDRRPKYYRTAAYRREVP